MLQSSVDIDFPHVTDVRHVNGHSVWLRFSDGVEGHVDFEGWHEAPTIHELPEIAPEALYDRLIVTGTAEKRDYPRLFADAMKREAAECAAMPEISRFFGMVIHMYFTEHEAPHFHARYGDFVASIDIETGAVMTRKFPPRALRLAEVWRAEHEAELLANWERLRRRESPVPIAPLE